MKHGRYSTHPTSSGCVDNTCMYTVTPPPFTVRQKQIQLDTITSEIKSLRKQAGATVDTLESGGDTNDKRGCARRLFDFLAVARTATSLVQTNEVAACPSRGKLQSAVRSWTGKADSPATKLKAAAVELESHNSSLELRASELRRTAIALKHQSKTDTAIRCLRKAKVLELQIASNYSALDAIEQQIDMIAQAAVQKQLTTTLASTNKTMRSQCVSVETAESAFEGAAEVRELATDLEDVIAGFTQLDASRDGDDDLASELEAMVAAAPLPQDTREFEIELLERKISEEEQRSALKQNGRSAGSTEPVVVLPNVPLHENATNPPTTRVAKRLERVSLLGES